MVKVRFDKLARLVFGLLTFTTVGARADSMGIEWSAPQQCPGVGEVRARVSARALSLGRATETLWVRGEVRQEPAGFRLLLTINTADHRAERELVAQSCDELVDALAWLVVLGASRRGSEGSERKTVGVAVPPIAHEAVPVLTQPDTVSVSRDAQNQSEQPAQPPVAPPVLVPPSSKDAVRVEPTTASTRASRRADQRMSPGRAHAWWYRAAAGAGVWSNELPEPQAQLTGGVGVGVQIFLLELRFSHLFERSERFAVGRTVRVQGDALSVLGCALFPVAKERVRLGPCWSLAGLYSVANVHGIASPERGTFLSFRGGAAGQLALRVTDWLELIAELGLGLPLGARPGFTVAGYGEVARASRLSLQTSLALGATW